jgi:MFS transporter, SP family, general alpha glucoside:H+ symporter
LVTLRGNGKGLGEEVEEELREIIETDALEAKMEADTSYWDCFRGVNARRTEIAVGVYAIQVLCGIYLVEYSTYFFCCEFMLVASATKVH